MRSQYVSILAALVLSFLAGCSCGPSTTVAVDSSTGCDGCVPDAGDVPDSTEPDAGGCTANEQCDDLMYCNGQETCDLATNTCVPGTPPAVDDGVACTNDRCDEANDVIVNEPDDTVCDQGDVCTTYTCDPEADCQSEIDPVCAACGDSIHDNGAYTKLEAVRPSDWRDDGVVDEFSLTAPKTEFCTIQFTFGHSGLPTGQFQIARIRIYALGGTGVPGLGDFGNAVPVFDHTYRIDDGSLIVTDTGDNFGAYDVISYRAIGTTFNLGSGEFGLHISFPDWLNGEGYWLAAPQTGSGACSYAWGTTTTSPLDLCNAVSPEAENLDFRLLGPVP